MASHDTACNIWAALPEVEEQCERQQGQHGEGGAQVQGLTLAHFSAQLEPCLTHKNTLHPLDTP